MTLGEALANKKLKAISLYAFANNLKRHWVDDANFGPSAQSHAKEPISITGTNRHPKVWRENLRRVEFRCDLRFFEAPGLTKRR